MVRQKTLTVKVAAMNTGVITRLMPIKSNFFLLIFGKPNKIVANLLE
jgi:hypothetical protein